MTAADVGLAHSLGEDTDDGPDLGEARYARSLVRGLAILSCFSSDRPILGIKEIANELHLAQSTTHRYVTTLAALGYLERTRSHKYKLGLHVFDLGRSALSATPLPELARPILEQLRAVTGYTASMGVLDGCDVLLTARATSTRHGNNLIPKRTVGSRLPAHCTSLGKVLLATIPDEDWRTRIGGGPLAKHGPGTITDKARLGRQLGRTRTRGYATSKEELLPDVLAVAVPVYDENAEVTAALSTTAHRSMVPLAAFAQAVTPQLIASAAQLSKLLGYHASDPSSKAAGA